MRALSIVILLWISSLSSYSASLEKVRKKKWGHLDVVWIEDDRVPTFSVQVYFADGALSDHKGKEGETESMFTGLFWGTNRFNQKEIGDNLEYFGVRHGFQVFHEYSTFMVYGLTRDIVPLMKKYCHLFSDSIYPKEEVARYVKRTKTYLGNLVADHSSLANHVFRRLSLRGTDFEYPVSGTLRSLGKIKSRDLVSQKKYFNNRVRKKLYLRGGRDILKVKETILEECGWGKSTETYAREVVKKQSHQKLKTKIVLIPVKGANQAQIRMGRFLRRQDIKNSEMLEVAAAYLGGNFISVLNEELRTKRGIVYSVGAFAQGQKYYGRSGISTFSGNENVKETLQVIKDSLNRSIQEQHLKRTINFLKGSHLFRFESNDSFLRTLMFFDHLGKDHSDLFEFPQLIDQFKVGQISSTFQEIFNPKDLLIVIVGDTSLLKPLKEMDSVQILSYKNYL